MLIVSNYHYIRPTFEFKFPSIFGVTPAILKKQLQFFKNTGDFVQPKDLLDHAKEILTSKDQFFLITFDDGLREQILHAFPVLDGLEVPALFFLNSINYQQRKVSNVHKIHLLRSVMVPQLLMDKLRPFNVVLTSEERAKAPKIYIYDSHDSAELKYLLNFKIPYEQQELIIGSIFRDFFNEANVVNDLYMNTKDIKFLAQKGFLGSHTHSHYPLGLLNNGDISKELETSKSFLENLTSKEIEFVSYPYGTPEACTEEVVKRAEIAGYKIGFTTQRGINVGTENLLLLKRYDCNDLQGGKNYKQN